jgi:hypothetical protein
LEDNLDFLAIGKEITARQCAQIALFVVDGAFGYGHKTCDSASGSSLTATAFTDEASSLSAGYVKTDSIHSFHYVDGALEDTSFNGKVNFEIANRKQGFG